MPPVRRSLLFLCAALACSAGGANAALDVGVTEDAGKDAGGAAFFATLDDVGLDVNRVSVDWDPAEPTTIAGEAELAAWLPQALATGTRVIFAVAPVNSPPRNPTLPPASVGPFVAFVEKLTRTFPTVKDYVIGNEGNQPRFWLPQFDPSGKPASAAAYLPVLAGSYDALKAVDPTINVIGVGLSPRGNDQPFAKSNVSRSPVRYLHELGVAYRKSKRAKPLMDELAFHPYPARNNDSPDVGYVWPNAGLPNLDRIKQAAWDAFNGTAQATFAETNKTFAKPLRFDLDEVGWQVAPLPALAGLYHGVESPGLVTIPEDTQADYYGQVVSSVACDPTVRMLSFFHLGDEVDLDRWQSGLVRADGSHRPSYDAVKQTLASGHGDCQGAPVRWNHTNAVVLPGVAWGELRKPKPASRGSWSFSAGAGEEANFVAAIFKAGPSKAVIAKRLAHGARPVRAARGTIKAKTRVVYFPAGKLKRGLYVYAIRMTAAMNPQRASVFVSRAFRVGVKRR